MAIAKAISGHSTYYGHGQSGHTYGATSVMFNKNNERQHCYCALKTEYKAMLVIYIYLKTSHVLSQAER